MISSQGAKMTSATGLVKSEVLTVDTPNAEVSDAGGPSAPELAKDAARRHSLH